MFRAHYANLADPDGFVRSDTDWHLVDRLINLVGWILIFATIVLAAFMSKYAFNNPDREAWYVYIDGEPELFATEAEAIEAGQIEPLNIHGRYTAWFTWAFFTALGPIYMILSCAVTHRLPTLKSITTGCFCFIYSISFLGLTIAAMVWRLNHIGTFTSGDIM